MKALFEALLAYQGGRHTAAKDNQIKTATKIKNLKINIFKKTSIQTYLTWIKTFTLQINSGCFHFVFSSDAVLTMFSRGVTERIRSTLEGNLNQKLATTEATVARQLVIYRSWFTAQSTKLKLSKKRSVVYSHYIVITDIAFSLKLFPSMATSPDMAIWLYVVRVPLRHPSVGFFLQEITKFYYVVAPNTVDLPSPPTDDLYPSRGQSTHL